MSDESREEYKVVEDKRKEMKPIFDRNDEDEKLYFLDPYKMKKLPPQQAKDMDGVANITLPDPQLYINKAIALLGGLDMQRTVKGRDMTDKQTTKVEEFLDDIYYIIDERLVKRGLLGLDGFTNEQDCVRGRIPARACIRISKEGNFIPDVLPLDARCFACDFAYDEDKDEVDMVWGAPWFMRSKAQIEREYGEEHGKGIGSKPVEVVDVWNSKKNIVFIDKKIVREQENTYGYPPFVQSIVPFGSMFSTEGAAKHQGESLLWPSRELWKEKNAIATILKTLTIEALRGGLQLESEEGMKRAKPKESPYGAEKVNPVEKGGGYKPMPINDIKNATRLLYSIIETGLQRAGFTALDYGSLTFPLSAIAVTKLTIARNDIMLPRIQAKAVFRQSLSRMIINQCIQLNKTFKLGQPGNQNSYSKGDLKGDYQINYHFFAESKEQTAADLAIANAAQDILSPDTIRRDVLKLKDPDGEEAKWKSAQAMRIDEVLFLFDSAYSLVDKDKPTEKEQMEATILMERAELIMNQRRKMGELSELEGQRTPQPETEQKGKELLPLFAGGGGQGRPRSSGPEEIEEESRE